MTRSIVCHAKDFRFYPEGGGEPFRITFQISKDTFGTKMEARMETGRYVRRLLQPSAQRMIRTSVEVAQCWRPR